MTSSPATTAPTSLLAPSYRWVSVGMVSLIFLAAFESLAVTTVMATVADDLDGRSWYSAAFSATLAASIVGMVAGGLWSDRRGPVGPMAAALAVFVAGLVLAGLAPGIEVFVAGRFLQGLGAGAMTVALYVLVARIYAEVDRPRMFGAFAAAWVLPSMVGPPVAGVVADTVGWRWVFLGVVVLAGSAISLLAPTLRDQAAQEASHETSHDALHDRGKGAARDTAGGRLLLAAGVSGGIVAVDLSGRLSGSLSPLIALAGIVLALVAVRPLVPAGTLRAAQGLPAVVLVRLLASAGFFATEIHVPYLLQTRYDAPPWLAGLVLTAGAFGWAGASQVQGRLGSRLSDTGALRAGSWLLLVGVATELLVVVLHLPGAVVPLGWVVAGAGMGLMYPRVSTYVLSASTDDDRGRNTAAMSISDSVGGASAIAVAGLTFAAVGDRTWGAFGAVFALTAVIAVAGVVVARRTVATPR